MINKKVLCVLRGSWVEPTAKDLQDLFDLENPPFIHLRYVVSSGIMESGKFSPRKVINASICISLLTCFFLSTVIPVVQSFTDASYFDV